MSDRMTAMDVEKQEFRSSMRGYDREDVRMFLRSVAEELGRLHLENGVLREDIGRIKDVVEDLRSRERTLQETLVTAQGMINDIKEKAQKEAELVLREARGKAERLLEQGQDQLESIEGEINRAKLERDAFENRLKSCIDEHMALLDMRKSERAQKDGNVLQLRRRSGSEAG
jgi:cell division initiation protein